MKKNIVFLMLVLAAFLTLAQTPSNLKIAEQKVRELTTAIDSGKLGGALQDREYVVAIYQQVLGRNPSKLELFTAEQLLQGKNCDDTAPYRVRCPRSQLLAWVLVEKEDVSELTVEILARNLEMLENLDLTSVPFWQPYQRKEEDGVLPAKKLGPFASEDDYRLYYGYMHCHTSYSDGQGTPEEAYRMAKEKAGLDFFAVTDHGELINLLPWCEEWKDIVKTADKFNEDGVFVALHGFEWSSPILGHINVIHSDEYTSCIREIMVKDILKWIADRPAAIGRFNHPGSYDKIGCEFDHYKLRDYAVKQMVGIEMHNGTKSVKYYFAKKGYFDEHNHLDEANQKGWKVGAVGGQDNHGKDWGFKTNYLVGLWAKSLTREGVLEAYRQRRTFATEDRNLGLSFKIDGAEMGSRLHARDGMNVFISLWDKDREKFDKVQLYKSGTLLKTFDIHKSDPKVGMKVEAVPGDYFYVYVLQEDSDAALSSPIWIVK